MSSFVSKYCYVQVTVELVVGDIRGRLKSILNFALRLSWTRVGIQFCRRIKVPSACCISGRPRIRTLLVNEVPVMNNNKILDSDNKTIIVF